MVTLVFASSVWSCTAEACTSTTCCDWPISRLTSARTLVAASTVRPLISAGRKPSFCTCTLYVPTATLAAVYSPTALVERFTTTLVAVLVMMILAWGITAPLASRMVPEMVPRSDCARATVAQLSDMIAMTTRKLLKNIRCSPYKARLNSVADNLSFPELGCKGADRGLTCDGIEVVGPARSMRAGSCRRPAAGCASLVADRHAWKAAGIQPPERRNSATDGRKTPIEGLGRVALDVADAHWR